MKTLEATLLGGCNFSVDGKPVTQFRTAKARAMLVYMLLRPTSPSRQHLQDLFWQGVDVQKASTNFRKTLSRLKDALWDSEESTLLVKEPLQLNPASQLNVDVFQFEALVDRHFPDEATYSYWQELTEEQITGLEKAASLYQGHFLGGAELLKDGERFRLWVRSVHRRLEQKILKTLNLLSRHHEVHGRYSRALQFGYQLLSLERHQEKHYQRVIRLEARSGHPSRALELLSECRKVFKKELHWELSPETRRLEEQIRKARSVRPHNLHSPHRPFVGRKRELALLRRALHHPDKRLMTLIGPGGVGKTRLALHLGHLLARDFLGPFMHGVFFVDLERAFEEPMPRRSDEARLMFFISEMLSLRLPYTSNFRERFLKNLRHRELLLILDLGEETVPGLMSVLQELLNSCPSLRCLVTSRRKLSLKQEQLLTLKPLVVPTMHAIGGYRTRAAQLQQLWSFPLVKLFVHNVQQVKPEFSLEELDVEGQEHFLMLCRQSEGVPLLMELLSSRLLHFSLESLTKEVERDLSLMTSHHADIKPRHRTLLTLLERVWGQLDEKEQSSLQQLSVFEDDFSLEAAETIFHVGFVGIEALCEHALLEYLGKQRYRLPLHWRLFLQSRRPELCENATRQRFVSFYAKLVESCFLRREREGESVLLPILPEEAHLQTALVFAMQTEQWAKALKCLQGFQLCIGRREEYKNGALLLKSLEKAEEEELFGEEEVEFQACLLNLQADWLRADNQRAQAEQLYLRVLQTKTLETKEGLHACQSLGFLALAQGELSNAIEHFQKCAETQQFRRQIAQKRAYLNLGLGTAMLLSGELEKARDCLHQSYRFYDHASSSWGVAHCLRLLGRLELLAGELEEAFEFYQQSLVLFRREQDNLLPPLLLSIFNQLQHLWGQGLTPSTFANLPFQQHLLQESDGLAIEQSVVSILRKELPDASQLILRTSQLPLVLHLCYLFAQALIRQGDTEQGYLWLTLLKLHPSLSTESSELVMTLWEWVGGQLEDNQRRLLQQQSEHQKADFVQDPSSFFQHIELLHLLPPEQKVF